MRLFDESGAQVLTLPMVAERLGKSVDAVRMSRKRGSLPDPVGWLDDRTPLWVDSQFERVDEASPIPFELRSRDRWVLWAVTMRRNRETKMPLRWDGSAASSTNGDTWTTYGRVAHSDKIGFVLNGDGIVCLDFDDCLVDGELVGVAAELVPLVQDSTWVEVSQSGNGLHVWGHAELKRGFVRPGVEVYPAGRFIAVTGRTFSNSPSVLGDVSMIVDMVG